MAHTVLFNIPDRELGKSDIRFKVKKDGELFGTLEVSKGALVWYPKGNSYGHKVSWTMFDEFMKDRPRPEKR
jgi:hypothetical protein